MIDSERETSLRCACFDGILVLLYKLYFQYSSCKVSLVFDFAEADLVETMNFLLLRSNQQEMPEPPPVPEEVAESTYVSKPGTILEGLIAEDLFTEYPAAENYDGETNGFVGENSGVVSDKNASVSHTDVSEEDGWITIPYSKCTLTTRAN